MSSKLIAGNATNGSSLSADTSGILEIQTGSTPTTAITIDASQNLTYTGTLTGGTGVVNLGSGQFYKDASGNVGIGTSTIQGKLSIQGDIYTRGGGVYYVQNADNTNNYYLQNSGATGSGNGVLAFVQGGVAERMRISSAGILLTNGLTSSPGQADSNSSGVGVAINTKLELRWNSTNAAIYGGAGGGDDNLYYYSGLNHIWRSNGTERMRIDSSGNLLVGGTAAANVGTTGGLVAVPNSGATYGLIGHTSGTASGSSYYYFFYNGNSIGSITQNGTTAVLYNTTSDYRLKSDVTPIKDALSTVEALKPVSFTWIDGRKDDGFLAHEIQAVIPNCVTGEKDAVYEDGTPKYQQMDNSGVIPFLVKAIQELNAKVDAQAAEIKALKGVA
jgi:hypothetical protein